MYTELAKFILNYSLKKGKIADKYFCDHIIKIILRERDLKPYVRKITYETYTTPDGFIRPALYDNENRIINLSVDGIIDVYLRMYPIISSPFDVLKFNIFVTCYIISHEIEHAAQLKAIDCGDEESEIIEWGAVIQGQKIPDIFNAGIINRSLLSIYSTSSLHNYYPNERDAIMCERVTLEAVMSELNRICPESQLIDFKRNGNYPNNSIKILLNNIYNEIMQSPIIKSMLELGQITIEEIQNLLTIPNLDNISESSLIRFGLK